MLRVHYQKQTMRWQGAGVWAVCSTTMPHLHCQFHCFPPGGVGSAVGCRLQAAWPGAAAAPAQVVAQLLLHELLSHKLLLSQNALLCFFLLLAQFIHLQHQLSTAADRQWACLSWQLAAAAEAAAVAAVLLAPVAAAPFLLAMVVSPS